MTFTYKKLFFRALDKALSKKRPSTTRTSITAKESQKDDFIVTVDNESLGERIRFFGKEGDEYEVRVFDLKNNDGKCQDKKLKKENIDAENSSLEIIHLYKDVEITYTCPFDFLLDNYTRRPFFNYLRRKISQHIFNKKRLIREERIKVLELLVERTIKDPHHKASPVSIMHEKYSKKFFRHPERNTLIPHLKLILDSLVATGDLKKIAGSSYTITEKAMVTLSEYELTNQRHKEQIEAVLLGASLTIGLIFVGITGIIVELAKWSIEKEKNVYETMITLFDFFKFW